MARTNVVPWLVGGAVVAGALLLASGSKAASSGSKPNPLKNITGCPVDLEKFNNWLIAKKLGGFCAPTFTTAPANYSEAQKAGLAPAEFVPYIIVLGDGSFWYYSTPKGPPMKSVKLRGEYDKYLGTLKGHPANMFMVM